METKNINPLKHLKETFKNDAVKAHLIVSLEEVKKICKERDYVIEGSIDSLISKINLDNSTLSSRKKLAKKIYYFMKKKTLRTMTALMSYISKIFFAGENKVKIKPSLLEQEIASSREVYKKLRADTEAARLVYREKKKLFHQKKMAA